MERIIGVRHRIKQTADQEARPTQLFIRDGESTSSLALDDETAELDWLFGRLPTSWRVATDIDDIASFPSHHVKRPAKGKEGPTKVPASYTGLVRGDVLAMVLGGSGDQFAGAASRRLETLGLGRVLRLPPFVLKRERESGRSKDHDAELLVDLALDQPNRFYPVGPRDRDFIYLIECYRARRDAMKDRIRCGNRLRSQVIGRAFRAEGLYPEGAIKDAFNQAKASDSIYTALKSEEARRDRDLTRAIEKLDVWNELLAKIEGCGPIIAAPLIAAISDIRRFSTDARLKKYCGVHVQGDGRFPRNRTGDTSDWSPTARQALVLLGAQFVYRDKSRWGLKLREYKRNLRERHPIPILVSEGPTYQLKRGTFTYNKDSGEYTITLASGEKVVVKGFKDTRTEVPTLHTKGPEYPLEKDTYTYDKKSGKYTITLASGEVVVVKGTQRYNDMHIHKMAIWRALTRFVEWLWREWTRLEATRASRGEAA